MMAKGYPKTKEALVMINIINTEILFPKDRGMRISTEKGKKGSCTSEKLPKTATKQPLPAKYSNFRLQKLHRRMQRQTKFPDNYKSNKVMENTGIDGE